MTVSATLPLTTWLVTSTAETAAVVPAWRPPYILVALTGSIVWTQPALTKIHLRTRIVPGILTGLTTGGATPLKPTTTRPAAMMAVIVARVLAWTDRCTLAGPTALIATTQPV